MEQNNVYALKRLAAKIAGGNTSASEILADTIPEAINAVINAFVGTKSLVSLTLNSVAGTDIGDTKITVSEVAEADKFKIITHATTLVLPKYGDDLSDWTDWDGESDITVTDGYKLAVCKVDFENCALAGAIVTADSKTA